MQEKPAEKKVLPGWCCIESGSLLLSVEGLAVGALIHGGISLVGAHQNTVQRAVVLILAMVLALADGAFDALIGMVVHGIFLIFFGTRHFFRAMVV